MCTTNPYYATWERKLLLLMGYSKYKKEQILSVDCILYFLIYVSCIVSQLKIQLLSCLKFTSKIMRTEKYFWWK